MPGKKGTTPAPLTVQQQKPLHNLPAQLTPFVGREDELAQLARLLADPKIHLLTLLGPGGMGKTRLALEMAQRIAALEFWIGDSEASPHAPDFSDGIYVVPLAGLESSSGIVAAVANVLNFAFQQGREPQRQLCDYLHRKQLLLILDNMEHLLEGGDFVLELLRASPGLKIVTTSRTRLNIQGEQLVPIGGLACPERAVETPVGVIAYSAVQLFIQHAQRVQPNFVLQDEDSRAVALICRLTQGMPLAIELAATWMSILTPPEIATEITRNLDFLAGEARNLPARQRSIRAVFNAAWCLLTPQEQSTFQKLSLFRGGFTREAAFEVAAATPSLLLSLLDKSFLQRAALDRFEIHELLQQYGLERLMANSELPAIQANYANYFLALAERADAELNGSDQASWIAQLERDHDNLRATLGWGLAQRATEVMLRLVTALQGFWDWRGYYAEMNQWFDRALALAEQTWGDLTILSNGELSATKRRQTAIFVTALQARAEAMMSPIEAEKLYHRCLALNQLIAPTVRTLMLYSALADIERRRGNYVLADQWHRKAEQCLQSMSDLDESERQIQHAYLLFHRGKNALAQSHLEACAELVQQAFALFSQFDDERRITYVLVTLGVVARYQGDYARAQNVLMDCYARFQRMGDTDGTSSVKAELGNLALCSGDLDTARAAFVESLSLMRDSGDNDVYVQNLRGIAEVALQQGNAPFAAKLLGAVEKIRQRTQYVIDPVAQPDFEATLTATRSRLGDSMYATAFAEGYALSLDQAVACALADPEEIGLLQKFFHTRRS